MTCTHVPSSGKSANCQNRNFSCFSVLFLQGSGNGRDGKGGGRGPLSVLCQGTKTDGNLRDSRQGKGTGESVAGIQHDLLESEEAKH